MLKIKARSRVPFVGLAIEVFVEIFDEKPRKGRTIPLGKLGLPAVAWVAKTSDFWQQKRLWRFLRE